MSTAVAIKRTGEMMLQGWKMLATACPICHTALMSKSGIIRCPSCDVPVKQAKDVAPDSYTEHMITETPKTPSSSGPAPAPAAGKSVAEPTSYEEMKKEEYDNAPFDFDNVPMLPLMSSFAVNKDDASYKISQKLLMGWTLLDKVCSIHHMVPLMKDHDGHVSRFIST